MKTLPSNIKIEEGCLGCALLSKKALNKLIEEVEEDDFYYEKCREVFKCVAEFYRQDLEADLILLNQKIKHPEVTMEWLMQLGNVTSSFKINSYIKELLELSQARKLLHTSFEIQDRVNKKDSVVDVINETIDSLKEISANQLSSVTTLHEMKTGDIYDLGSDRSIRKTGFKELDGGLWGIGAGELIILAALTSHGKSALVGNIAMNIAKKYEDYVLWFSLEMTKQQMRRRFVSQEAQVDSLRIKMKKLESTEIEKVKRGMAIVDDLNIALGSKKNNINDIITDARRFYHRENLSLMIVDYLQLVQCFIPGASLAQVIGKIVNDLKALAEELEIPIICLSQFNRGFSNIDERYPQASDLKESSTIEQAADMIWLLHKYTEKQKSNLEELSIIENLYRLHIAKNRDGKANFYVDMEFIPEFTLFREV